MLGMITVFGSRIRGEHSNAHNPTSRDTIPCAQASLDPQKLMANRGTTSIKKSVIHDGFLSGMKVFVISGFKGTVKMFGE